MTTTISKFPATVPGNASLTRPLYRSGLLLQDDDLTQAVDYTRELTRLLFRTVFGCGVLCGLQVTCEIITCENKSEKLKIDVACGVALDCRGDVVEIRADESIEFDPPCGDKVPEDWVWVVLGRKDKSCAPRDIICSSEGDDISCAHTRIRDGYEIRLFVDKVPQGFCGFKTTQDEEGKFPWRNIGDPSTTDPCYEDHYKGRCGCECTCDGVVLARLKKDDDYKVGVKVDHSVRRFVRPALIKDWHAQQDHDPELKKSPATSTTTSAVSTPEQTQPAGTEKKSKKA